MQENDSGVLMHNDWDKRSIDERKRIIIGLAGNIDLVAKVEGSKKLDVNDDYYGREILILTPKFGICSTSKNVSFILNMSIPQ
jgi:hypothetical protein